MVSFSTLIVPFLLLSLANPICRAVHNHPPHQFYQGADLENQIASNAAISFASRHFTLPHAHLHPSYAWPPSSLYDQSFLSNTFLAAVRDPQLRFLELGHHSDSAMFAAPWRIIWPGHNAVTEYVLFLNAHPVYGLSPVGFADFPRERLPGRPYDFWTALHAAAETTQSQMARRFPIP